MSLSTVLTEGLGSWGSVPFLIREGLGQGAAPPPVPFLTEGLGSWGSVAFLIREGLSQTGSVAFSSSLTESGSASESVSAARQLFAVLAELGAALDTWSTPGGAPPIVKLAAIGAAIRIVRISTMSHAEPVNLDLMRQGTTDTRGLDLYPALALENDTVASITGITVVRIDGNTILPADLTITPVGFAAPFISANADGNPNSAINWWQQAGATIAVNGYIQYRVTISFLTTAGRPLEYDAYQTVTSSLG